MKFRETISYPYPIRALLPVLTDPAFLLRKYEAQGAHNIQMLSQEVCERKSRICVQRAVPVSVDIPAFAKSMVPAHITLIQTDSWDKRSHAGQLDIQLAGLSAKVVCQMQMVSKGDGTLQTLDFDVRVGVPLIGGKLEELLARDLRQKFTKDTQVTLGIISSVIAEEADLA